MNATSTDRDDSWGVYRPGIESHLETCSDYLDHLQRSVAGEIAPDRHYFHDKAHQLHEAVRVLVRRGQDIERWLRACDATVESDEDGHTVVGTCEGPSGHAGPHDGPPREPVEQLCQQARTLADVAEQAGYRLGTIASGVDQQTAIGGSVSSDELDLLREVSSMFDEAGREARQLAQRVLDAVAPNGCGISNASASRRTPGHSVLAPSVDL